MWKGIYSDITLICYIHLYNPTPKLRFNTCYYCFGVRNSPKPSESEHCLSHPKLLREGDCYIPNGILSGGHNGFIGLLNSDPPHLSNFSVIHIRVLVAYIQTPKFNLSLIYPGEAEIIDLPGKVINHPLCT